MTTDKPNVRFVRGLLHPGLAGSYVIIAVLSVAIFMAYRSGYGSWLRTLAFIAIPSVLLTITLVSVACWGQARLWRRLVKLPGSDLSDLSLREVLAIGLGVAIVVLPLCTLAGSELRKAGARRVCDDCAALVSEVRKMKEQQGVFPSDVAALVKAHKELRRGHSFYFGVAGTNGVAWDVHKLAQADVSLFSNSNRFQVVVPIERMSPISFSSFYVYSLTSERSEWRKTLLHWSLLGAYTDDPSD